MRFIKLLALISILGYVAIKGYLWYDVKSALDENIARVSPIIDISYGSISSSLKGKIGVEDITLKPRATSDEFTIQELSFTASNLLDLVTLGNRFKEKEPPEYLALEIKKVKMDLDSDIFRMINQMQDQAAYSQSQEAPLLIERLDAIGCGNINKFHLNDYISMGYDEIEMDIAMDMEYKKNTGQLKIGVDIEDRDIYKVDLDMQFSVDSAQFKNAGLQSVEPGVSKLNIEYNDTGYYKIRNNYCAKINEGSVDEYIEANIKELTSELDAVFPEKYTEAYRQFMRKGGAVVVRLNPDEETILSGLKHYKAADVAHMLGLNVAINGTTVDIDKIQWKNQTRKPGEKIQLPNKIAKPVLKPDRALNKPVEADNSTREKQYRRVKISRLARYIGNNIQVDTKEGKHREGVLKSVDKKRIQIMVRLSGGQFTFPVNLSDILRAKVYR